MANELASAQVAPQQAAVPTLPSPLAEVAQGVQPAAILPPVAPNTQLDPAQEFVIENFEVLPEVGLEVYEAPDMSTVVFNPQLIDRASVEQAAASGELPSLLAAPPQVEQPGQELAASSVAQSRAAERPQMAVQSAPAAPALPAPKVPASIQNLLAKARVRNMGGGPKPAGIVPNPISSRVAKRPI